MKTKSLQVFGLLGVGGALLMFVGDMCLYGHFGSGGDAVSNLLIADESDARIVVGGFIGPIAAVLYCLGFFSVYGMISSKSRVLAAIVAGGAAGMMVIGGAYHAMWGIRAFLIKAGLPSGEYLGLYNQIKGYTLLFYNTALVVGEIASLFLLYAVLSRRSLYPRWTAIVNPGFLFLFYPFSGSIPAPLGAIVRGGYVNLVFLVFFSVSVISTLAINREPQTHGT